MSLHFEAGRHRDRRWDVYEREIRAAVDAYPACHDRSLVLGEGDSSSRLVLIGEAPGSQEDLTGRPFVGQAGKMLDGVLELAGIQRESIWITNVVKCRPVEVNNGRLRNRPPTRQEFDHFVPWLERELGLIEPELLVCLGATAARAILGLGTIKLGQLRGQPQTGVLGIETLITYHPSFLLRRTRTRDQRYAEMVADLKLARSRLGVA